MLARNHRVLAHEAETPMRGHTATCCLRAQLGVPTDGPSGETLDGSIQATTEGDHHA